VARDLGMSPANIYRFFASKTEIHQAICARMLAVGYQQALEISLLPISAADRLRKYLYAEHQLVLATMLDEEKVHEMVVVAIERDWHVIEKHIDLMHEVVEKIIRQGIQAGEFADQDAAVASRCFGAATLNLCHPQMVAQCLAKQNRAMPDELVEFVIKALR
jgi:AcrR family transcriptional regulator